MKHEKIIWNPGTENWFCAKCGHTSEQTNIQEAELELDQQECTVPSSDTPGVAPGTETIRLIRKPYKMRLRTERSSGRFVAKSDEGTPVIQLELFHDTVPGLKAVSIAFELLSGTTAQQAMALVEAMNERIVGVIVTPKDHGEK